MTTLREAAQQALEALEIARMNGKAGLYPAEIEEIADAITALKAALVEDAMQKFTDVNQEIEAALAEPEGEGNLPPPLQEPKDFDHGIGADRFRVVRGAFWWHVLIGDSPTEHGKFRSRASAEKMAADLLREFRNGAFVQHEAALAEQPAEQEPVADRAAFERHAERLGYSVDPDTREGREGGYWSSHTQLMWLTWQAALAEPDWQDLYLKEKKRADMWRDKYESVAGAEQRIHPLAEPVQEPVAWIYQNTNTEREYLVWRKSNGGRNWQPLYIAPPQRKPLTEEEIKQLLIEHAGMTVVFNEVDLRFARAIERAHGIT